MFSKNILNLSLLIIIIIYTYFYNNNIILPHSKNEDDLKYINTKDNIIGVTPGKHNNLFEINKDSQNDFYTSSTLINTEKYFNKNKKIKNNTNDNYIINTKQVDILNNKYNINIYNKDKIINGKEFLVGNNLIKGYEK